LSAQKTNDHAPQRVVFVVELDYGKMIRAFDHQLLHIFGAGLTQGVGEATRVEGETGKSRNAEMIRNGGASART